MKKRNAILLLFLVFATASGIYAQEKKKAIYDPSLDGIAEIGKMVKQAGMEGKHVLIQVGGNW